MPLRDDERSGSKERRVTWRNSDLAELENIRVKASGGSPQFSELSRMVELMILTGNSAEAISILSDADETLETMEAKAVAHIECGDYAGAEKFAMSAFKNKAGSASACVSIAICKSMEWDIGAAMDFFEIAESCAPDYGRLLTERGIHYLRTGMNLEAVEDLRKSVEIQPFSGEAVLEYFEALVATGAFDDALAALEQSLSRIPDCAGIYFAIASIHKSRKDNENASRYVKKALELCPGKNAYENFANGLS